MIIDDVPAEPGPGHFDIVIDMNQVEVMQGPQALFFENSRLA